MVASNRSIEMVVEVMLRHVDKETGLRILKDLSEVPGNASFVETIKRLHETLKARKR